MGWYFRRSKSFGPFRLNLSKGGIGWSVGTRGLRIGRSAKGRTSTNVSIPGTGLGYRKSGVGCLVWLVLPSVGVAAAALSPRLIELLS